VDPVSDFFFKHEEARYDGTCLIPEVGRQRQEDHKFKVRLSYILRCCLKKTKAWECSLVVGHLLSMYKALGLIATMQTMTTTTTKTKSTKK
jgi:hypothetical protein